MLLLLPPFPAKIVRSVARHSRASHLPRAVVGDLPAALRPVQRVRRPGGVEPQVADRAAGAQRERRRVLQQQDGVAAVVGAGGAERGDAAALPGPGLLVWTKGGRGGGDGARVVSRVKGARSAGGGLLRERD
jgi:hypothetical protein